MKQTRICVVCGAQVERERFRYPPEKTTCNLPKTCRNTLIARIRRRDYPKGPDNPNWKGGPSMGQGYVYVRHPGHPRAKKDGRVKRADLVMEQKLGRPLLPGEVVHHKDKDRANDSPENLELMTRSEHQRMHVAEQKGKGTLKGTHKGQARRDRGPSSK